MKITLISDTHTRHHEITNDLPGGDLLIHSGDLMNSGRNIEDIKSFCKWFNSLDQYTHKVFIAGNHDRMFQEDPERAMEIVNSYKNITYLQDSWVEVGDDNEKCKIYGSPWQPWFYDWAFNLPRLGTELQEKWNMIPEDTDVLITHSPPNGYGDLVNNWRQPNTHVGCECLINRIGEINPLVNVFGHIHEGYGVELGNKTLFVNASICNPGYSPINKPIIIDLQEVYGEIIATHVEI